MKLARIIIAILFCFFTTTLSQAEEFTVLVIPNCVVDSAHKNIVGNVNIEELLARKFIIKLEDSDVAYAPTLQTIKISIKNNPQVTQNMNNPMGNMKILSGLYGVSNVLLISSKTAVQAASEQKEFWNKLNLPVISPNEANTKLITTVTLYNTKKDEVIWSDVFYHRISSISGVKNNYEKIRVVNAYYDELIPKIINNMRSSKETHAIRVTSQEQVKKASKAFTFNMIRITGKNPDAISPSDKKLIDMIMNKTPNKSGKTHFFAKKNVNSTKQEIVKNTSEKKSTAVKTAKKIKPNLEPKENVVSTKPKESFLSKLKNSVHLKYDNLRQDYEANKRKNIAEQEQKKLISNKTISNKTKADLKQRFANKNSSKKQEPKKTSIISIKNPTQKPTVKKDLAVKTEKLENKKVSKSENKLAKKISNIKSSVTKKKLTKKAEKKPTIAEQIKNKYKKFKNKREAIKQEKIANKKFEKENKEIEEYIIMNTSNSEPSKYVQTRLRNNSRNYIPKYNYSINDL